MNALCLRSTAVRAGLCAAAALSIIILPLAAAPEPSTQPPSYSYLADTYDIHAGVYFPQLSTQILVNQDPSLPGTFIDLENNFGLPDRQARPWLEFNYRPGTYSTIRFIYFDTERSGTREITRDIRLGDRTFTAPSTLSAYNAARYYWLSYQFLILRDVFNEFGISPGIMVADVKSRLSLQSPAAPGGSKEVSFLSPIPLLGLYLSSQFMPRVFLKNTVRVLDINAGDYEASLFNYTISVDYNPLHNWGIGAGYFFNHLEIKKGFINYNGSFIAKSDGGMVYLKYFFL